MSDNLFDDIMEEESIPSAEEIDKPVETPYKKPGGKKWESPWDRFFDPDPVNKELLEGNTKTYTLAVDKKAPTEIIDSVKTIVSALANRGYILRTNGNTDNPAVLAGQISAKDNLEIYLPWSKFGEAHGHHKVVLRWPNEKAYGMAAHVYKKFNDMKPAVRAIMSSEMHTLFGKDMKSPVDFVIAWTPDGAETSKETNFRRTGFMASIIETADKYDIPVFNLAKPNALDRLKNHLKSE